MLCHRNFLQICGGPWGYGRKKKLFAFAKIKSASGQNKRFFAQKKKAAHETLFAFFTKKSDT
jgi:hypothetical protein